MRAVRIDITSEAGEKRMEKPAGSYITIEAEGIAEEREGVKEKAEEAVAEELRGLVKFHSRLRVLIAGLGEQDGDSGCSRAEGGIKGKGNKAYVRYAGSRQRR